MEIHDFLSEFVHEGRLLYKVNENILDLGHDRTLDHLVEDLEAAIIFMLLKLLFDELLISELEGRSIL